jgi:cytochrome c peroxidase
VPSLPSQPAGYVKYAIDDLPAHYEAGAIQATNNTPVDNPITDDGATLGRVLFYDKRLSHNDGASCASCHRQENGFSDPNQFSTGFDGQQTGRHAPGLSNAVYYANGRAFWDERAATLEDQALMPIQSPVEMGMDLNALVAKLGQTAFYPTLFQAAFGTADITPERIGKAIAQFERSMVSYQSKYDTAFAPGSLVPDFEEALTPQELAGQQIFHGNGRCSQCHTTNAHVSDQVHNIGLPNNTDPGAGDEEFKAPSLRNIEVRGRFMHDGRFATLEEVVQFYNTGVTADPNLDPILKNAGGNPLRLNLNPTQVANLVAYLKTLTDNTFLTSNLFSDPFVTLPGDYTGDGEVDSEDYDLWRASFGSGGSLAADGSGDGIVDIADFIVWQKNVGRSWLDLAPGGGGSTNANVPEPGTLALSLLSIGLLTARRRPIYRRRRPVKASSPTAAKSSDAGSGTTRKLSINTKL